MEIPRFAPPQPKQFYSAPPQTSLNLGQTLDDFLYVCEICEKFFDHQGLKEHIKLHKIKQIKEREIQKQQQIQNQSGKTVHHTSNSNQNQNQINSNSNSSNEEVRRADNVNCQHRSCRAAKPVHVEKGQKRSHEKEKVENKTAENPSPNPNPNPSKIHSEMNNLHSKTEEINLKTLINTPFDGPISVPNYFSNLPNSKFRFKVPEQPNVQAIENRRAIRDRNRNYNRDRKQNEVQNNHSPSKAESTLKRISNPHPNQNPGDANSALDLTVKKLRVGKRTLPEITVQRITTPVTNNKESSQNPNVDSNLNSNSMSNVPNRIPKVIIQSPTKSSFVDSAANIDFADLREIVWSNQRKFVCDLCYFEQSVSTIKSFNSMEELCSHKAQFHENSQQFAKPMTTTMTAKATTAFQ